MELTVGITELKPHWQILLDQIGVPYRELNRDDPVHPEKYAVLILSSSPDQYQAERIREFLHAGGGLLCEANYAAEALETDLDRVTIKYVFPDQDSVFSNIPLCDLKSVCLVAADAQHLPNQDGIKTVSIQNYKNGKVIILPSNFCDSILRHDAVVRKNFPSLTKRFPSERVSQVARGSIRHIVQRALVDLFHSRRLPFAQLWCFPDGAKSIFAFRVDTDSASKWQIEKLYRLCRDNQISATWFVDTKSHADWIDYFAGMENQEIAYHCYNHRIYPDSHSNRLDMETGLSLLRDAGIEPKGYAAPLGDWNIPLSLLIQEMGFEYSSEFGCAYDDLPFFPYLENSFSTVVQVPIHPISTRRLYLARHNQEQMVEYYCQVMRQKLFLDEPIILYDHPIHANFSIFDQIFKEVRKRNIMNLGLGDYQDWWRKRSRIRWTADYSKSDLWFTSTDSDPSVWVKTSFPDRRNFLVPLNQPQKRIPMERTGEPHPPISNPQKLRRLSARMIWQEIESYYGKLKR